MPVITRNVVDLQGASIFDWVLLETQVASSDATIDVLGLSSTYFMYKFIWYGLAPANDLTALWIRTSTSNGSSYDSGASDYAWANHRISSGGTHAVTDDTSDSEITVAGVSLTLGNGTNETTDAEITLFNPSDAIRTKFLWTAASRTSSPTDALFSGSGFRNSLADVDAVRFLFSAGDIASGTLKVYGIRA